MATNVNLLDRVPGVITAGVSWVLAPFEDPEGLDRPLWRDTSRHQAESDCQVMHDNGVWGKASRCGISWGYQDPRYFATYASAGDVGMYRTNYFVPFPDQPVVKQADNWFRIQPEIDVIPRVIDLELSRACYYKEIADFTWKLSEIVLARDGIRPIIYSRAYLINKWLASWNVDMLNEHYWWLAQYMWDRTREHPGPPTLPNRVREERVILHQTADKKPGFPGEVESRSVDYNRWEIGDDVHMVKWIEEHFGEGGGPPPVVYEPIEPIRLSTVNVQNLNVRGLPEIIGEDLGGLTGETIVPIVDEAGEWRRIDGWVHSKYLR